jgi:hypothetical protein
VRHSRATGVLPAAGPSRRVGGPSASWPGRPARYEAPRLQSPAEAPILDGLQISPATLLGETATTDKTSSRSPESPFGGRH